MPEIPQRLQDGTSLPDAFAYINQAFDAIDDENRTKIIKNAAIPQILFGYQKGGFGTLDYGLKVSKINPSTNAPYDVTTATNDQLAFSSGFNYLKVALSGTGSFTIDGSGNAAGHFTYPHGLGYAPTFVVYAETFEDSELTGIFWEQANETDSIYSVKYPSVKGASDDTNFYVVYGSSGGVLTPGDIYHFKYIVYVDPVAS